MHASSKPTHAKTSKRTSLPNVSVDNNGPDHDKVSEAPSLYYVPDRWYSFTICPEEQEEKSPGRWKTLCDRIHECLLSSLTGIGEYRYNIEISEPRDRLPRQKVPRIHAHGRFRLRCNQSVRQYLLFGLYNLTQLGYVEVDTISDLDKWDTYCEKQMAITGFETVVYTPQRQHRRVAEPYNMKRTPPTNKGWDVWSAPPSVTTRSVVKAPPAAATVKGAEQPEVV